MGIRKLLFDFFLFLKKPNTVICVGNNSLSITFQLFICLFIIRMAGIVLEIQGFRPLILYFTRHELARQQVDSSLTGLLLGALVMAPLLEETAYRWGLRFSPLRTSVSLGLIVFYWLPYGGTYSTNILGVLNQPGFYLMVAMAFITGLTAFTLFRIPYFEQKIRQRWARYFGWIFYLSALLFGLMHVFNVREISLAIVSLAPFITFQQIVLGLFNGYVRMRYGFRQAIIQHSLFNVLPVLIQLAG